MRNDEFNDVKIVNERQNIDAEFTHAQKNEYSSFNNEYKDHEHELNDIDLENEKIATKKRNARVEAVSTFYSYVPHVITASAVVGLIISGLTLGLNLFPKSEEGKASSYFAINGHVEELSVSIEVEIPFSHFSNYNSETGEPVIEEDQFIARLEENNQYTYDLECTYEINIDESIVTIYSSYMDLKYDTDYKIGLFELNEKQYVLISDEYSFHTEKEPGPEPDPVDTAKTNAINELKALVSELNQDDYSEENWALIQQTLLDGETEINACTSVDEVNSLLETIKAAINDVETKPIEKVLPNPEVQVADGYVFAYVYLDFSYFDETNPDTGYPVVQEGQFAALVYFSDSDQDYQYEDCDIDLSGDGNQIAVYVRLQDYSAGDYYVKFIDNINGLETEKVAFNIPEEETPVYNVVTSTCVDGKIELYFEVPYDHFENTDYDTGKPYVYTDYFKGKLVGVDNDYSQELALSKYEYDDTNEKVQIYFVFNDVTVGKYYFVGLEYINSEFIEVTEHTELTMIQKVINIGTPVVTGQSVTLSATIEYSYFDEFDSTTGNPIISEGRFTALTVPGTSEGDQVQIAATYEFDTTNNLVILSASFSDLLASTTYYAAFYDTVDKRYSEETEFDTEAIAPVVIEVHEISIADNLASFYIELPYSYFDDFDASGRPNIEDERFKAHVGATGSSQYCICEWTYNDETQTVKFVAEARDLYPGTEYGIAFFDGDIQLTEYYQFVGQ